MALMERYQGLNPIQTLQHAAAIAAVAFLPTFLELRPSLVFAEQLPDQNKSELLIPPQYQPTDKIWEGPATTYNRKGCVGCSPNMIMANGKPLDDNALTLAFMRAPLGSMVYIENSKNGLSAIAEVTDRGGFEKYGFIADLSALLNHQLGRTDLTPVKIILLEERPTVSNRGEERDEDEISPELPTITPKPQISLPVIPTTNPRRYNLF